ncbi:branched-chain amino acid transport system II carrier protein [Aquimarina rhabdastrellae]
MKFTKESLVTGFALFSMFFGAGNLILPPNLGLKAGDMWSWVTIGFAISAVLLPLLGIVAHARLQGTMFDFAKKVSPVFSMIYCFIVYAISISLPSPRTASVTHEMAIAPFFGTSSLLTSSIYFVLVLFFVLNRSKVIDYIGKFLTPLIFIVILSIICVGIFTADTIMISTTMKMPFIDGLLEGYQTFDAIGAVVVGGVLIVSLKIKGNHTYEESRSLIAKSGIVAGIGLFIVYAGLIYNGALFSATVDQTISRTELLSTLSIATLGNIGNVFLSVLVSLACFTTAVGITTGTADFVKGICKDSTLAYTLTAIVACLFGIAMGQMDVHDIIVVAIPALMFIYPITIILILLNVLPAKLQSTIVFKAVVLVTIICSIPDFIKSLGITSETIDAILQNMPLGTYSLGWLLPAIITFVITNLVQKKI